MKYRLPSIEDRQILMDYVKEHYSNNESSISASNGLTQMNYSDWVNKINRNSKIKDDDWGQYYLYLVFDDENNLIGLLNIMYNLTEELRNLYGDVGYSVRPSERRKGYATKMLEIAKNICREKGMKYILLGCYKNNYGSKKTIIKNGGYLVKEDIESRKISNDCTINLEKSYFRIDL